MKKLIIALILLPAIALTVFLYQHKDSIGKTKEISEKEFIVKEMTCEACAKKIKAALKPKHIDLIAFNTEKKSITLKYDINKYKLEKLNKFLAKLNYSLTPAPKDKLEIIDYKIKFN